MNADLSRGIILRSSSRIFAHFFQQYKTNFLRINEINVGKFIFCYLATNAYQGGGGVKIIGND